MAYNKVIDKLGNVLLDLTSDSVQPSDVKLGKIFHDRYGNVKSGILNTDSLTHPTGQPSIDFLKVNFIDIDGTLLHQFTLDEAENLESLPQGPDRTYDNLEFEEWNWTLESVKMLKSKGHGALIGPLYKTVDDLTHIKYNTHGKLSLSLQLYFKTSTTVNLTIDWGDDTSETITNTSSGKKIYPHTYVEQGVYDITISSDADYYLGGNSWNQSTLESEISSAHIFKLQLSEHTHLSSGAVRGMSIKTLAFHKNCIVDSYFNSCAIECICAPNQMSFSEISNLHYLKYVAFYDFYVDGRDRVSYGTDGFRYCYKLEGLILPPDIYNTKYAHLFDYSVKFIHYTTENEIRISTLSINYSTKFITLITNAPFYSPPSGGSALYIDGMWLSNTITSLSNLNASNWVRITIPSSVTSITSTATYITKTRIVDLTALEHVPTKDATSLTPSTNSSTPVYDRMYPVYVINEDLINDFKTATNWSALADYMVTPEEYVSLGFEEIYGPL